MTTKHDIKKAMERFDESDLSDADFFSAVSKEVGMEVWKLFEYVTRDPEYFGCIMADQKRREQ